MNETSLILFSPFALQIGRALHGKEYGWLGKKGVEKDLRKWQRESKRLTLSKGLWVINSREDKVCSRAPPSPSLCLFLYAVGIDEIKFNSGLFPYVSPRRNVLHNIYHWLEYQLTLQMTGSALTGPSLAAVNLY